MQSERDRLMDMVKGPGSRSRNDQGYVFSFDMLHPALFPATTPALAACDCLGRIVPVHLEGRNLKELLRAMNEKREARPSVRQEINYYHKLLNNCNQAERSGFTGKDKVKGKGTKSWEETFSEDPFGEATKLATIVKDVLARPKEKTLIIVHRSEGYRSMLVALRYLFGQPGTRWAGFKSTENKDVRTSDEFDVALGGGRKKGIRKFKVKSEKKGIRKKNSEKKGIRKFKVKSEKKKKGEKGRGGGGTSWATARATGKGKGKKEEKGKGGSKPVSRYEKYINDFNSYNPVESQYGESKGKHRIRVLVVDAQEFTAGVSFFGVQRLILVNPPPSFMAYKQQIGRPLRACRSHMANLPPKMRRLHIDVYVAKLPSREACEEAMGNNDWIIPEKTPDEVALDKLMDEKHEVEAFVKKNFVDVAVDVGLYVIPPTATQAEIREAKHRVTDIKKEEAELAPPERKKVHVKYVSEEPKRRGKWRERGARLAKGAGGLLAKGAKGLWGKAKSGARKSAEYAASKIDEYIPTIPIAGGLEGGETEEWIVAYPHPGSRKRRRRSSHKGKSHKRRSSRR